MKKVILLAMVAIFGIATANAQFEKGVKRIKASTSAFDMNFSDEDFNLNLGLDASYFLATNVALKAGIGFEWKNPEDQPSWSKFRFGIGADYYFYRMLYGGVGFDFSKTKSLDFEAAIQLEVGATYYIAQNVYLNPAIYFNSGLGSNSTARFGLQAGFGVNF